MSADNYYEINAQKQEDGSFRFGVNMGFASDENEEPLYNNGRTRWFDTLEEAVDVVSDDYAEYGWSIVENEDWQAYQHERKAEADAKQAAREAELREEGAAAERKRIVELLRVLAELRSKYNTKDDLRSDNQLLRQLALSMSVSIDTMRLAAEIVENNLLEEAYGFLPSWHWNDPRLRQLGLEA